MTAKISWELRERGVLRLTVADGPKETHYTLRRNHSIETVRDVLSAVLRDLGGITVALPTQPGSVAPVPPVTYEDLALEAQRQSRRKEKSGSPLPMTEEESLEELKRRAYTMAQKNLGFRNGDLPDDTASTLSRMPAHERIGHNPGYPTLDEGGVTAVDGSFIDPSQFRSKPQFNLDNHED